MSDQSLPDPETKATPNRGSGLSFTSPQYVRFDSLLDSKDLGAWDNLKADLSGEIGAAAGTQSLFFKFRLLAPGPIRLQLTPSNPWTDRFLQLTLLDAEKRGIPLDETGRARRSPGGSAVRDEASLIQPPGEYYVVVTSSQWQRTPFGISLGVNPRCVLAVALTGRGGLGGPGRGGPSLEVAVARLSVNLTGRGGLRGSGGMLSSGRQDRPIGPCPLTGRGRLNGTLSTRVATNPLGAAVLTGVGGLGGSRLLTSTGGSRFWVSRLTTATEVGYDTRGEACIFPNGDSVVGFVLTPAGNTTQYSCFVKRDITGQVLWTRRVQEPVASPYPQGYMVYPLPNNETLILGTRRIALTGYDPDPINLHIGKLTASGELAYYKVQRGTAVLNRNYSLTSVTHVAYHEPSDRIVLQGGLSANYFAGGNSFTDYAPLIGRINPNNGDFEFRVIRGRPEETAGFQSSGLCVQSNGRLLSVWYHSGALAFTFIADIAADLTQIIRAYQYTDATTFKLFHANSILDPSGNLHLFSSAASSGQGYGGIARFDSSLNLVAFANEGGGVLGTAPGATMDLQLDPSGGIHCSSASVTTHDLDGEIAYRHVAISASGQPTSTIRDLHNTIDAPLINSSLRFRIRQYGRQGFNGTLGQTLTLVGHEIDMPSSSVVTSGVTWTAGLSSSANGFPLANSMIASVARNPMTLSLAFGQTTAQAVAAPVLLSGDGSLAFALTQDPVQRGVGGVFPSPQVDRSPEEEPDPYKTSVALHLPMSGMPDTATFTDYSIYTHSIVGYGTARLSTAQAKYPDLGANYPSVSCYLDGSGSYLALTNSTHPSLQLRKGDFTLETWIYLLNSNAVAIFENSPIGSPTARPNSFYWGLNASRQLCVYANGATRLTSVATVPLGVWTHIELTLSQEIWRQAINGVPDKNAARYVTDLTAGGGLIGRYCDLVTPTLAAYLQDFRLTPGAARFTHRFTPRSTPIQYTPIAVPATVVPPAEPVETAGLLADVDFNRLTLFIRGNGIGNSFKDDSRFGHTVVAWGNTTQVAGAGKWGGPAGRVDGDGDYLTVTANAALALGGGDYDISGWVTRTGNATGVDAPQVILDSRTAEPSSQVCLRINSAAAGQQLTLYVNGVTRIVGSPMALGVRTHVRVSRVGGVTRLFMNGKQVGQSWADTTNYTSTSWVVGRGALQVSSSWWHLVGDFNDIRILAGRGLSTADFTPPSQAYGTPPNNAYRYIRLTDFAPTTLDADTLDLVEIQFYDANNALLTGVTATASFAWTGGTSSSVLTNGVLTSASRIYRDTWSTVRATAVLTFDLGVAKTVKSIRIYAMSPSKVRFPASFNVSGSNTSGSGYGDTYSVPVGSPTTWTVSSTDVGESGLRQLYLL